jgi:hypothetical protein
VRRFIRPYSRQRRSVPLKEVRAAVYSPLYPLCSCKPFHDIIVSQHTRERVTISRCASANLLGESGGRKVPGITKKVVARLHCFVDGCSGG